MNVLFRMDDSEGGLDKTRDYFRGDLITKNNRIFYTKSKLRHVEKGDEIYFAYKGNIVAIATLVDYVGERPDDTSGYNKGYQLENIETIHTQTKIDNNIFRGRGIYIKSKAQEHEIERILDSSSPNENEVGDNNSEKKKSPPQVDTNFTEIDDEEITARKFLPTGNKRKDLKDSLDKTEHAEKTHQEMLEAITEFLISNGVKPFESESIDLMFQVNNKRKVCEIKSATQENLLAQASRGAFQLTCYIDELIKNYDDILPQLILQKTYDSELESFVERILYRMNIPVLFYDPNKSWPDRVPQLLS